MAKRIRRSAVKRFLREEQVKVIERDAFFSVTLEAPNLWHATSEMLAMGISSIAEGIADDLSHERNSGLLNIMALLDASCLKMKNSVAENSPNVSLPLDAWTQIILAIESFAVGLSSRLADPVDGPSMRIAYMLMITVAKEIRKQVPTADTEATMLSQKFNESVASMKVEGSA